MPRSPEGDLRSQSFACVLAHRFHEMVARAAALRFMQHERFLHERRKQLVDVVGRERSVAAHDARSVGAPTSGKDREAQQQPALACIEQVVTPIDKRTQRLLARQRGPAAAGEEGETVVEPFG